MTVEDDCGGVVVGHLDAAVIAGPAPHAVGEMASQSRILVGAHMASMFGFAGLILGFG